MAVERRALPLRGADRREMLDFFPSFCLVAVERRAIPLRGADRGEMLDLSFFRFCDILCFHIGYEVMSFVVPHYPRSARRADSFLPLRRRAPGMVAVRSAEVVCVGCDHVCVS